jgi:hypothetical protein
MYAILPISEGPLSVILYVKTCKFRYFLNEPKCQTFCGPHLLLLLKIIELFGHSKVGKHQFYIKKTHQKITTLISQINSFHHSATFKRQLQTVDQDQIASIGG